MGTRCEASSGDCTEPANGPHADPLALSHHEDLALAPYFAGVYLPSFTVKMMRERSSRP
jgi:hypothetical protein